MIDDRGAKGGQIRGRTARGELAVHEHLLIERLRAREAQIGPQAGLIAICADHGPLDVWSTSGPRRHSGRAIGR